MFSKTIFSRIVLENVIRPGQSTTRWEFFLFKKGKKEAPLSSANKPKSNSDFFTTLRFLLPQTLSFLSESVLFPYCSVSFLSPQASLYFLQKPPEKPKTEGPLSSAFSLWKNKPQLPASQLPKKICILNISFAKKPSRMLKKNPKRQRESCHSIF